MGDWGIALVGLGGALAGAIVGFIAVVWQHRAQKAHELRQRCAELIYLGEQIRNEYVAHHENGFGNDDEIVTRNLEEKERLMSLTLRMLEITASPGDYRRANTYALRSGEFVEFSQYWMGASKYPDKQMVLDLSLEWQEDRDNLIAYLQGWRRRPINYLRAWRVDRALLVERGRELDRRLKRMSTHGVSDG